MQAAEGDDDAEMPVELTMAWQAQRWGYQAVAGSEPMDYGLLKTMNLLLNTYNTVQRLRSARGDQIHNLSQDEDALLAWLIKEGLFE